MWLLALFTVVVLIFSWLYFFSRWSYQPWWLFYGLWFLALAASQLHWSILEKVFLPRYWWLILLGFIGVGVGVTAGENFFQKKKKYKSKINLEKKTPKN